MKTVGKIPAVDSSRCNRCNQCIYICPRKAILEPLNTSCAKCIKYCITMDVPCSPEKIIFSYDLCDSCGLCVTSCPQNAIYWFEAGGSSEKGNLREMPATAKLRSHTKRNK